ncbi:antirestriction protein ArdA [Coprobacillaceae bacterium CR2/5/TPMF4]|nr:antirestriction protein ArdA [Coprobacillaceae bacterium CR2/5/TPMF4]
MEEVYEHKDEIYYYPDCADMTDVAYYFIDELQVLGQIPLPLQNYIDYEAYGRDLSIEGRSLKQAVGYARYHIRAGRSATGKVATDSFFLSRTV